MEPNSAPSASKQLQTFTAKRRALERLLLLARSLAKLSGSLESLTSFKDTGNVLTAPAQEFYNQLSARLNAQPKAEVIRQMTELDGKLREDMENIVSLAGADENSIDQRIRALNPLLRNSTAQMLDEYLVDFERRAKLAIALRLFLTRQKIPTPGIEFSFSEDQLEDQLIRVRERETHARSQVRERVVALIDDTEKILNNSAYPEDVRDEVLGVRNELMDCLSHIDSGLDIVSLPLIVDEVIVTDTPVELRKPRPPQPEPESESEQSDPDAEPGSSKAPAQPVSALELPDLRKAGLLRILWVWLKTPQNVDWASAKKIAHWEVNRKPRP